MKGGSGGGGGRRGNMISLSIDSPYRQRQKPRERAADSVETAEAVEARRRPAAEARASENFQPKYFML